MLRDDGFFDAANFRASTTSLGFLGSVALLQERMLWSISSVNGLVVEYAKTPRAVSEQHDANPTPRKCRRLNEGRIGRTIIEVLLLDKIGPIMLSLRDGACNGFSTVGGGARTTSG